MKNKISAQQTASLPANFKPDWFPMPGERGLDPYFGLSRASYYAWERLGKLRLCRLRKPGKLVGKVLIPYADVAELIRSFSGKPASREEVAA
jgi:hypothetical protein